MKNIIQSILPAYIHAPGHLRSDNLKGPTGAWWALVYTCQENICFDDSCEKYTTNYMCVHVYTNFTQLNKKN
jgi:hypothetical protein